MTPTRIDIVLTLTGQLDENVENRNRWWREYWEGRRMVTVGAVPERTKGSDCRSDEDASSAVVRIHPAPLFPSFPNLASKNADMTDVPITAFPFRWENVIRDCIARLKAARDKDSTNRNLSTLLAVVVKVQKDLETLVGDDWKQSDAAVEAQVTRDDRS